MIGIRVKVRDKDNYLTQMVQYKRECGKITCNMGMGRKNGLMALIISGCTKMVARVVLETIIGKMEAASREILRRICLKDMEFISGQMVEKYKLIQ